MIDKATFAPFNNRREFLTSLSIATVAMAFPSGALGMTSSAFHTNIAEKAKALASGGSNKLRLLMPEGCGDNIEPVATAFKAATGVVLEVIETPVDDINTQLSLDSMSGDSNYDLALPATFGIPDLVSARAIVSLSEYAAKHEPSGFRDGGLYTIGDSFDHELYGFQADGDAYLMFYNQKMLGNVDEQHRYEDTFGSLLDIPLTWQELDRQMAFFNRKDSGMLGGLLFRTPGYLAWEWWVRFHAKGYWPLSKTLTPQINSDAGVEALEEMIRATEHLAPESAHLGLFQNWERYSQGDIYCNIGWGGSQKYLNSPSSPMRGHMRYGPTPGGLVDNKLLETPYFNWGWNYVVVSGSKQPELAYLFALFASTPEMSTTSVQQQGGFFDPFRPEHYDDPKIQSIYSSEFLSVHKQSLLSAIPDLYLANQSQYFQALSEWLDKALAGSVEPKMALDNVAKNWTLINNRSDSELQTQRWKNLREKYPPALKASLRDLT